MKFKCTLTCDTEDPRLIRFLESHSLNELFHFLLSQYIDDLWTLIESPEFIAAEEAERQESEKRQLELVHALSIDYNLVCFFDLDTGRGNALRINECKYKILDELFAGELSM